MSEKLYYYYTRWYYEGDSDLAAGTYHSTVVTTEDWSIFIRGFLKTKELTIRCFDTEEEMREFAKTVGL